LKHVLDITLALESFTEGARPVSLHQKLYEELRQAILGGRLVPRQKLPSTRALARSLGISRSTVTQSYEQLLSEGYLETKLGSGTFVGTQLPDDLLHAPSLEQPEPLNRPALRLSKYALQLAETEVPIRPETQAPISFRYGRPALDRFPLELWRKLLSRHCRSNPPDWLDYSTDLLGYAPLRKVIAGYISRARAVHCEPEQILITNGTQQALDLVMRLLIEPGDTIAMEDPGYSSARRIFISQGAKVLPIAVDESGLIVQDLIHETSETTESIRLVYVTPSHQFPTGVTLSLPRRLQLLAWAQQTGTMLLEDDYDSEYRYGDRPIPSLQGLDRSHSVLYIGTFSKVLFPSLRIGYLVLPHSLISLFSHSKWLSDRHLPILEQRVLTDFIEEGHLERHIRKMRSHYDQCRQILVQALKTYFGEQVTILGEKAGLHLMVRLRTQLSDEEIIQRAAEVGVGLFPARPHYLKAKCTGAVILGYAELDPQQIQTGIQKLAQVL
jgi:GntR family transcriptional regulator / MocR family aminotransferase